MTVKANTGFDMESARPRCETCTRMWNIAVQCPCFLVLNSNGWADFLFNPLIQYCPLQADSISNGAKGLL